MNKQFLDAETFASFIGRFATLPLARTWFGDHLALYLELGKQVGVYRSSGRTMHERHIFTGYDWTLTDTNGELTQRADLTESRVLQLLGSPRIQSVTLDGCTELIVYFDNKCKIQTCGTERNEWSLYEFPNTNVSIENGRPILEVEAIASH